MTRDQIDAATAIIEAALAGAEERGAERERKALADDAVQLVADTWAPSAHAMVETLRAAIRARGRL